MGFLVGLLVGAIAALLYAPGSGDEMREEFRTRSDDLKKRAEDLQRIAQKLSGEAQTKGRELIDDAKREWNTDRPGGTTTGTTTGGARGDGGASGTA
jgi:gas vesicle protein